MSGRMFLWLFVALLVASSGCVQTTVIRSIDIAYEKQNIEFTTSDNVVIKGNMYFPKTEGKHPVIVLVHQLNGDRSQWDSFIPLLIQQNYSLLTYDMRGLGESTKMANGSRFVVNDTYFYDMTKDMRAALDFAKSSNKVDASRIAVIGASVGGNVAYLSSGLYEVKTAVSMSPSLQRLAGMPLQNFHPRSVLFMADKNEAADANELYTATAEPKAIKIYDRTAHGVELLGDQKAAGDIFDWLSKTL